MDWRLDRDPSGAKRRSGARHSFLQQKGCLFFCSLTPSRVQCPHGSDIPRVFDARDDTLVLVPIKHVIDGKNLTELAGLPTVYPSLHCSKKSASLLVIIAYAQQEM